MAFQFKSKADRSTVALVPIERKGLDRWMKGQKAAVRNWLAATGFLASAGEICPIAGEDGRLDKVLIGVKLGEALWAYAGLPGKLGSGSYRIEAALGPSGATKAALGWALGTYAFRRYKKKGGETTDAPTLVWPKEADKGAVDRAARSTFLVRDLINIPAGDLGPAELAAAARRLAREHGAEARVIAGEALLKRNYPTIHAVGRASSRAPRLIDIGWGRRGAPRVTLVGKGVCFDSGGLDLKTATGMLRMKKDMGGGANMLGLAGMVMAAGLDVRLRVLIPAVENSVSGNAIRPMDVIKTRSGLTVEVGNTDAEGRLILADALSEACRERPELVIDCATLTGAARVALGPELPALFCNDDKLAADLLRHAEAEDDPMWRMPLWPAYEKLLDSKVADINNVSDGGAAGAITAALFLKLFITEGTPWIHFDIMAWNATARPGRPVGGEAQAMRAAFALIAERFGGRKGRQAKRS